MLVVFFGDEQTTDVFMRLGFGCLERVTMFNQRYLSFKFIHNCGASACGANAKPRMLESTITIQSLLGLKFPFRSTPVTVHH